MSDPGAGAEERTNLAPEESPDNWFVDIRINVDIPILSSSVKRPKMSKGR